MWMPVSCAADLVRNDSVVSWNEVQSGWSTARTASVPALMGSKSEEIGRKTAGEFAVDRIGAALPPPPGQALRAAAMSVHPSSLAGISSSVIPAVTGDLYWSRPSLDMRVIGQSIGQNSTLRLSRPTVGVSVGTTSNNPPFVGIK